MDENKIVISIYYKDPGHEAKAKVCKDTIEGGIFIEYTNATGDVIKTQDYGNMSLDQAESIAEEWALEESSNRDVLPKYSPFDKASRKILNDM